MMKGKGFSLLELIVAMFVSVLLFSVVGYVFSRFYLTIHRSFEINRKDSSLVYVSEIVNYDLMRAGYHYDGSGDPVLWDSVNKKLTIRFVNYDNPSCETKFWSDDDPSCNYEIAYYLDNGQLYRSVDAGANGSAQVSSMLSNDISVVDFSVDLVRPKVEYTIKCQFQGLSSTKIFDLTNVVICHNWQ